MKKYMGLAGTAAPLSVIRREKVKQGFMKSKKWGIVTKKVISMFLVVIMLFNMGHLDNFAATISENYYGSGPIRSMTIRQDGMIIGGRSSGHEIEVWGSKDKGNSWNCIGSVVKNEDINYGDVMFLAVPDTNKVFCAFREFNTTTSQYAVTVCRSDDGGYNWVYDSTVISGCTAFVGAPWLFIAQNGDLQCYYDSEPLAAQNGVSGAQWIAMQGREGLTGSWDKYGVVAASRDADASKFVRDGMASVVDLGNNRIMLVTEGIEENTSGGVYANVVRAIQSFDGGYTWNYSGRKIVHQSSIDSQSGKRYNAYCPMAIRVGNGPVGVVFCTDEDFGGTPDASNAAVSERRCHIKYIRTLENFETWGDITSIWSDGSGAYAPGMIETESNEILISIDHFSGNQRFYKMDVSGADTRSTQLSNIRNKQFFFLGSSVTYGYASGGVSFADYLAQRNGCTSVKEAVSGTTLVDNGSSSYVQRMINNLNTSAHCDHFICQLSTNDASQNKTLGSMSTSYNLSDFDTSTIIGAMEYIIAYAKQTWNCPVSFYTSTYYNSANYQAMVDALYKLQEKWDIGIIDLWNNESMRNVSAEDKARYMADDIHPTAVGYEEWWTPVFEDYLQNYNYSNSVRREDVTTVPGTGSELYSNDFGSANGLQYYPGLVASTPTYDNRTVTIGGGNSNKIIVEDKNFTDFVVEADIKVSQDSSKNSNQGGLVFRASNAYSGVSDGYDGYYFGIDALKQEAILGKVHGNQWTEIAKKKMTVKYDTYYHVSVAVSGNEIKGYVDYNGSNYAKVIAVDSDFSSGSVGLRHWLAPASFKNLTVSTYTPQTVTEGYTNAVLGSCADPDVLYYDGVYYMYSTNTSNANNGFKVYSSTDLTNWTDRGWCLTKGDVYGTAGFWAPDLVEKDGIFYMYYVADEHLSVATSTSPVGPFTQTEAERVPMHTDTKEIDAHVFQDDDGQYYIYFVRFYDGNGNSGGNHIWGAKLNSDMRTIDESTLTCLISPTESWETDMAAVAEGPYMLKKDGVYYLTYSGSHFQSNSYGSGYATSTSPLGIYNKYAHNPIMQSNSLVHGAGHHCVTTSPDGSELFMVYHCHKDLTTTEPRSLCIDRMQFTTDEDGNTVLEVMGPTVTIQPLPSDSNNSGGEETTTQPENPTSSSGTDTDLVEVFGMMTDNPESGVISVVWGNPGNGQLFNVYVDGELAVSSTGATLANVACAYYTIPTTEGNHTVKVTGTLNGKETEGVTQTVNVSGSSQIETVTVPSSDLEGYVTAGEYWTDLSNWSVYFASGWGNNPTGSYKDGGSYDDFGVYVKSASLVAWGIQIKTQPIEVVNGKTYTCTVTADFNTDMTDTITFKEENTQVGKNYTLANGTNTFEITFTANSDTAQIFFDLGMLPVGANFKITSFRLVSDTEETETTTEEVTTEATTEEETTTCTTIDGGIEINGYQISATAKGMRTIYSVDSEIDGKEVVASGIIYSLADFAEETDMYVGSSHYNVRSFESTEKGVCPFVLSESDIATSYAMTMKFSTAGAPEYGATWRIRAYAELSDGSYIYTACEEYKIYDVADVLYQRCLMNTQTAHEYLYTDILFVVNPLYERKDYINNSTLTL